MSKEIKETVRDIGYSCNFHPERGFHEVGCPHLNWTAEQLQKSLTTTKQYCDLNARQMLHYQQLSIQLQSELSECKELLKKIYGVGLAWGNSSDCIEVDNELKQWVQKQGKSDSDALNQSQI